MFRNANETTIKLHQACTQQDLEKVNNIIRVDKEKIDVKQLDEMKTLLKTVGPIRIFASLEKLQEKMTNDPLEEIVKLLCEIGVDLHQKDYRSNGRTALHLVCHGTKGTNNGSVPKVHANPRIVEILLEHGAFVHAKDSNGDTPLHIACGRGNLEVVQTLLQHHADVNASADKTRTPLHHACWYGHGTAEIVQILLDHGASVHAKDCYGNTPLHDACGSGKLEVVQTLIQRHADVHDTGETSKTPLHIACTGGHLEVVQELLKYKPKINAICKEDGRIEMTTLMCAALMGDFEIVEELLKHGADINFSDPKYGSALHLAIEFEYYQIVNILLKNGCNTKVRAKLTKDNDDLLGYTPFEVALDMKSIKVFKIIAFHET